MLLLDSSLQLPPPVLVTPLCSDVLLRVAVTKSPFGEWVVGAVNVHCYTVQQVHLVLVGPAVLSQLQLALGLEQQMFLPTHQHWSGTATSELNGTLVECFGPGLAREPGNMVGKNAIQILGLHAFSNKWIYIFFSIQQWPVIWAVIVYMTLLTISESTLFCHMLLWIHDQTHS